MTSRRRAGGDATSGRSRWRTTLTNVTLYELGWFGCVLAAAAGRPVLALAAALASAAAHVALVENRRRELALVAVAAALGLVVDTATVRLGALSFAAPLGPDGIAPLWVVGMWAQFAIVFRFCLAWLSKRYLSSALLGAVGGPLSFIAGARLGAVDLLPPLVRSVVILAAFWALALPLLVAFADGLGPRRGEPGRYRFDRAAPR